MVSILNFIPSMKRNHWRVLSNRVPNLIIKKEKNPLGCCATGRGLGVAMWKPPDQ